MVVIASGGCAFESHPSGPGNGRLEGNGAGFGSGDGGVEDAGLDPTVSDPTVSDPTVTDTSTPDTIVQVRPEDSTYVVFVEPACTPGTERSSCPGTSCDPVTLTCTTMMLASRATCESCFTDSNCASMDHRCVWMTYQGEPFPDKQAGFCLKVSEPVVTVDGGSACEPPFTVPLVDRESPSGGTTQSYCGIHETITTCLAVRAFHNRLLCPSGRDDECPAGGLCRAIAVNGNKTEFACTYACTDDTECSTPASNVSCAGYCGG